MTEKLVLIDTDCGTDDSWGIFMALMAHRDPQIPFRIVGITCTHGNGAVSQVTRNVGRTLEAVGGENIPIFEGCESPMVLKFFEDNPPWHGEDGFGDVDWPSQTETLVQPEHAVNAIIRLAEEFKGKLTIMALGPLTNLAMAVRLKPSIREMIKDIYIMGGNHQALGNTTALGEFNFLCDVEAVHVVLKDLSSPCELVVVPWETCVQAVSSHEFRQKTLGTMDTEQIKLMNKAEAKILAKSKTMTWLAPDALTMAVLIEPLVSLKSGRFSSTVELAGYHARGMMVVNKNIYLQREPPNSTIIEQIDRRLYEKMLIWAAGGPHYGDGLQKEIVMLSQ